MNKEVITLDAEEVPIEQAVEKSFLSSLEKHEINKKALEEKRDECLELKLNGQDKEAYTLIHETRLNMKTNRVVIEKICKKGREEATKTQKAWIAIEKDYTKIVSEGEDYLEKLEEEYKSEQERIRQEEKRKQEEAFIIRQAELTKMGVTYSDGNFVLNEVSFEAILIKESDDEVWDTMKKKFYDQFVVNEATRLEEEKKKEEAAAALETQRLEQERRQQQLEAREIEIKRKEQEEADRQEAIAKEQAAIMEKEQRARNSSRINQLQALGMSFKFDDNAYSIHNVFVPTLEITVFTEDEWDSLINEVTPVIEERKKAAEEKRLADIEDQKRVAVEEATKKERERIAEEQRVAEEKRLKDEQIKAEEQLKATDKVKWQSVLTALKAITLPEMKHPAYKQKILDAKKLICKIIDL